MPIPKSVKNYLEKSGAPYEAIAHKTVYTAFDAAQTLRKELKEVAKNLLVQADKTFALIIVPADRKIDLNKVKRALGAKKVSLSNEKIMVKVLKIKPGAISSFGKLHRLETWVDKAMLNTQKAIFSTGSFTDSVFMKVKDFLALEQAQLADFAVKGGYPIPRKVKKQMKAAKKKARIVKAKKLIKKAAKRKR